MPDKINSPYLKINKLEEKRQNVKQRKHEKEEVNLNVLYIVVEEQEWKGNLNTIQ